MPKYAWVTQRMPCDSVPPATGLPHAAVVPSANISGRCTLNSRSACSEPTHPLAALLLMGIEIRLFLVIDAFSRFSGTLFACSASLLLQLAKQRLDSTAAGSGRCRRLTGAGITIGSWRRFRIPRLTPRIRRFLAPANSITTRFRCHRCGTRGTHIKPRFIGSTIKRVVASAVSGKIILSADTCRCSATPGMPSRLPVYSVSVPFGDGGNPSPSGEAQVRVTWSHATLPTGRAHEERPESACGMDTEVPQGRAEGRCRSSSARPGEADSHGT